MMRSGFRDYKSPGNFAGGSFAVIGTDREGDKHGRLEEPIRYYKYAAPDMAASGAKIVPIF
jgi:hypothetical protein